MTILLWLAGSAAVLTLPGDWLSHRFGRGAYTDSYEQSLNENQCIIGHKMWPI